MSEKTEQATPKRIRKARQDGDIAKSAEFTGVMVLVLSAAATWVALGDVSAKLVWLMKQAIELATRPNLGHEHIADFLQMSVETAGGALARVLGIAFAAAAFFTYLQVGSIFTLKPLMPDAKKLNPIQGAKNMFSKNKAVDLIKNLLKLSTIGVVGYSLMKEIVPQLVMTPRGELSLGLSLFDGMSGRLVGNLIGVLFVFGAADFLWQRHSHKKKLMMSKDEVKREYKESEGDGQIKGKRKQLHQQLLNDPGVKHVPKADAVVVNPTHIAIAIEYDARIMEAPKIIARGRGALAQQIKRVAKQHRVPIVRNVPLARGLIDLEHDEEIPPEFYDAVAEILMFVQSLER